MKNKSSLTEAGQAYAVAYNAHYTLHDLPLALQLYRKLLASHPDAPEADYSRMQVQNIVNAVVPDGTHHSSPVGPYFGGRFGSRRVVVAEG